MSCEQHVRTQVGTRSDADGMTVVPFGTGHTAEHEHKGYVAGPSRHHHGCRAHLERRHERANASKMACRAIAQEPDRSQDRCRLDRVVHQASIPPAGR
jgi:hypothetical protein